MKKLPPQNSQSVCDIIPEARFSTQEKARTPLTYRHALSGRTTLACFTPLVMIVTFLIEAGLALFVLWKYRLNATSRLAVALLLALAVFQLAEYNICEGSLGFSSMDWARIGFVSITLLPVLGIHLAATMAGTVRRYRWLLVAMYVVAAVFAISFLTVGRGIQDEAACLGNYALFHVAPTTMRLYALYYYGLLLLGIGLMLTFARDANNRYARLAQYSLVVGYLAFLLPTSTVNIIDPSTIAGIPSIMCGFAVLFAVVLVGYTLPANEASRNHRPD